MMGEPGFQSSSEASSSVPAVAAGEYSPPAFLAGEMYSLGRVATGMQGKARGEHCSAMKYDSVHTAINPHDTVGYCSLVAERRAEVRAFCIVPTSPIDAGGGAT
jgi:hypothetical protein